MVSTRGLLLLQHIPASQASPSPGPGPDCPMGTQRSICVPLPRKHLLQPICVLTTGHSVCPTLVITSQTTCCRKNGLGVAPSFARGGQVGGCSSRYGHRVHPSPPSISPLCGKDAAAPRGGDTGPPSPEPTPGIESPWDSDVTLGPRW